MLKKILIIVIPTIGFLVALFTLGSYGINWDEPYHYRRGQAFLQYYLTGLKTYQNMPKYPTLKGDSDNPNFRNGQEFFLASQDTTDNPSRRSYYQDDSWDGQYFIDIESTYGHPPLNDILAALFNKIFYQKLGVLGDLESYKFFPILTVTLVTLFIAIFMFKEFGLIESIFSGLVLTTYPLLLSEQHFDVKDPVETVFYTLTILSAYLGIKKNSYRWLFLSTLFFSLAFATKFNIVFSIFPLIIWFIYYFLKNKNKILKNKLIKKILITSIIAPIIIFGVLILSYPTLWKAPISGILEIIRFYKEVGYPTSASNSYYFFGFFNAFPLIWIAITTPPVEIFLLIIALILSPRLIKKNSLVLLLFLWLGLTIGRNSLFKALNYGGVRLIMEYIPPFAMITGISSAYLIHHFKNKKIMFLSAILLFLLFIPSIVKLAKIHPNENLYFNYLIGGLAGAKAQNIPSWGNSDGNAYIGGINWLNKNAEQNALLSTPIGNTSNIPRIKLRSDIAISPYYWSGLNHKGEYLIELTYDYTPMNYFALRYLNEAMIPVYEVQVDGVAIAKVWKNDKEHVKSEFTKTKTISTKTISNTKRNTLEVDLTNTLKIMSIEIEQPTQNCTSLKTGYVTTSTDNKNWAREPEDIAVDQLNREEVKKTESTYKFYFMAREAKTIVFNTDDSNNCLLKAKKATITYLITK